MASTNPKEARLNFRLPTDLKTVIEEAAATMGQSVSDYAIAALVERSQAVLQQRDATELSHRDRTIFMALLDDADGKPNRALTEAAKRYKCQLK